MILFRVVWGLWVVMAILSPTSLFKRVDFPTLGLADNADESGF